jgi:hypothetical protein
MSDLPIGIGTGTLGLTPGSTDVSGELAAAGMAFGDLVRLVGQAVADTQKQLNQTAATSTSALARTLVDMIAVQEVDYDDAGNITQTKTFKQKLPLIDYVDPVLYQWSVVNLQGRFSANEFAASASSDRFSESSTDDSGNAGLFIFLGGGYTNIQYDSTQVTTDASVSVDSSVGLIRMTAVLEPRHDIGVPKPRQAIQGPLLSIDAGPITDNGTTSRDMIAILSYVHPDASPIANAVLSVSTSGVPWTFANAAQTVTDANGRLSVKLTRTFVDASVDRTPIDVVVSARIGLVNTSTTLTF